MDSIDIRKTGLVPPIVTDYLNNEEQLRSFYSFDPSPDGLLEAAKQRSFSSQQRATLLKALRNQYEASGIHIEESNALQKNIELLSRENTFTVCTGHQLCLFSGPLYFIYKILSITNLAAQLNERYPEFNFVPVFWEASEDHDFEEIRHVNIAGNSFAWNKESQQQPVGRLSLEGLKELVERIFITMGDRSRAAWWKGVLQSAYDEKYNLAQASRKLLHELFSDKGLVVLDGDDPLLKQSMKEIIEADIFENRSFRAIAETNKGLEKKYKLQVNGREINFFYLHPEHGRQLIRKHDNRFLLNDTGLSFSEAEIRKEIDLHPERFSPNVILRPVYQEKILPNISYTGGPAEVAYWLQLKNIFEAHGVAFPVLMLRNSFLLTQPQWVTKIAKTGLGLTDIFQEEEKLVELFLKKRNTGLIENIALQIDELFQKLFDDIRNNDPQTGKDILQLKLQARDSLLKAGKQYKKTLAAKDEENIARLLKLRERVFPGGSFQERYENIMTYDLNSTGGIIPLLQEHVNAFDSNLRLIFI